jgi:phospholipid/cholesterol/gamma-HCH transport system substrate-binding protein
MGSTAENKRSVIVGIFLALAVIILVAGVFVLGGQQNRFVQTVMVKAVFDDVAGLKPGNNVWFSGVKIGTVKEINFFGKSQVEISMKIEEKAVPFIRKDAQARISSESMIGNKIIVLFGGSQNARVVQDGDLLASENPLDTDDLMETLQQNNKNLVDITQDFKVMSARLVKGQGTVGAILTDSLLADNFRQIVRNLQQASATTVRASGALARFTNKLNDEEGLAGQLLTDTTVFNQLKASITQLEQTTATATEITNNLKQTSAKLNQDNNALGVMLNDEAFANQLKNTMKNLEASSGELGETMKAAQNSFLLKGYFKRKAVREAKTEAKQNKPKP